MWKLSLWLQNTFEWGKVEFVLSWQLVILESSLNVIAIQSMQADITSTCNNIIMLLLKHGSDVLNKKLTCGVVLQDNI
jgi:hypothetical protein